MTTVSDIKVLIFSGGQGERWGDYLGTPKQLIEIDGKKLLHRTVELLGEQYIDNITIVSSDNSFKVPGCDFFDSRNTQYIVDSLLKTKEIWSQRTIILLGDVWYSPKAIKKIIRFQGEIGFFGRPEKSFITGCTWPELFAINFFSKSWDNFSNHINKTLSDAHKGGRGKLWQVYNSMSGIKMDKHPVVTSFLQIINDLTDDFDFPIDYDRWIIRYRWAFSQNPIKCVLFKLWCLIPLKLGWSIMKRWRRLCSCRF